MKVRVGVGAWERECGATDRKRGPRCCRPCHGPRHRWARPTPAWPRCSPWPPHAGNALLIALSPAGSAKTRLGEIVPRSFHSLTRKAEYSKARKESPCYLACKTRGNSMCFTTSEDTAPKSIYKQNSQRRSKAKKKKIYFAKIAEKIVH